MNWTYFLPMEELRSTISATICTLEKQLSALGPRIPAPDDFFNMLPAVLVGRLEVVKLFVEPTHLCLQI